MEYRCNLCNREFGSEESLNQHNLSKHSIVEDKKGKMNVRKYFIFGIIALIIISSGLLVNSYIKKPGQYDEFAKCLTEKGAIMYGNDFCSYTAQQINFFGKSKQYLNYVKCFDNKKVCDDKGIETTPTWEIDGQYYPQVQNFERLSALTGCEI